jgi:hypothetical protein
VSAGSRFRRRGSPLADLHLNRSAVRVTRQHNEAGSLNFDTHRRHVARAVSTEVTRARPRRRTGAPGTDPRRQNPSHTHRRWETATITSIGKKFSGVAIFATHRRPRSSPNDLDERRVNVKTVYSGPRALCDRPIGFAYVAQRCVGRECCSRPTQHRATSNKAAEAQRTSRAPLSRRCLGLASLSKRRHFRRTLSSTMPCESERLEITPLVFRLLSGSSSGGRHATRTRRPLGDPSVHRGKVLVAKIKLPTFTRE